MAGFVAKEKNALLRRSMLLEGHLATLMPFIWRRFFPPRRLDTAPWSTTLTDRDIGTVKLTGLYRGAEGNELLIVVHGLGGSVRSGYMGLSLLAAEQAGVSCLLLNVRGADQSGEDIPHAGLIADLEAAIACPTFAGYEKIYVLGYSLGGHLALAYALAQPDPRVKAVAALCSPLDIAAASAAFDAPFINVYRRHVLQGLADVYAATHARRGGALDVAAARAIRRMRDWDEKIVAPRFGFASADDYYAKVSVGPRLGSLTLPSLYVGTQGDPMVPYDTVHESLQKASPALDVRWSARGGHLGLPPTLDLGFGGPRGLESQVLSWLRSRADTR